MKIDIDFLLEFVVWRLSADCFFCVMFNVIEDLRNNGTDVWGQFLRELASLVTFLLTLLPV